MTKTPRPGRALYLLLSAVSSLGALITLAALRLKGRRSGPAAATPGPTPAPGGVMMALFGGDPQALAQCARDIPGFPAGTDPQSGRPWLRTAMDLGAAPAVAWMLEHGADANTRGDDGLGPLESVILREGAGAIDLARMLLAAGADPNTPGALDETALHLAAASGDADMVRLLLDHGADPNARDAEEPPRSPADVAGESGHGAVAALLRERMGG